MGIFDRLLQKKTKDDPSLLDEPNMQFGKYSDRNKTHEQYESWDKSVNLFKEKKYLDAYLEFFNYLKDKETENVTYSKEGHRINFSFIQGSKIVHGTLNEREVQAEAEVARFEQQNIAVMRKLLQENYYLYFSKFAVRNDIYTLKYFSPVEDAHPSSMYYALKELATEADMWDDVLVAEFDSVQAINIEHIEEISNNEKQIKLKYFRKWINETINRVNDLDGDKYTGPISYSLLTLAFKIFYLLAPEGTLLDDIRFIQGIFYQEDEHTPKEKNLMMLEEFNNLQAKSDEEILKSFYKVKATFAVTQPTTHAIVAEFIEKELEKAIWYIENNHPEIVQDICEYILSYINFSHGIPAVANDMLLILWRLLNPEIFDELGFKHHFIDHDTKKPDVDNIKKRIAHIISHSKKRHGRIEFNAERLDFSSRINFAISFFKEFKNLNYD